MMWVEHLDPRATTSSRANDYDNCYLSCRFCNGPRGANPRDDHRGRCLLDPCLVAWGEHFHLADDKLQPQEGDTWAEYTEHIYNLNDARKRICRKKRRETLRRALEVWNSDASLIKRLLAVFGHSREALECARQVSLARREAFVQLVRYQLIPADASDTCGCRDSRALAAPGWLVEQGVEVEVGVAAFAGSGESTQPGGFQID